MKAYFIGSGIGSLAGAAFMVRDAGVSGEAITIFEKLSLPGGSLDAGPHAEGGYSLRGGRMLTADQYECLWDLLKTIPSLEQRGLSVYEETVAFNARHPVQAQARLIDRNRFKVDVSSALFTASDCNELLEIVNATEDALGASAINRWLSPAFFQSDFWLLWQTTFGFQPWHSAAELRRYLHRFPDVVSRIATQEGVRQTVYNQYDSIVRPLEQWLAERGVKVVRDARVADFHLRENAGKLSVSGLTVLRNQFGEVIPIGDEDLVFFQNGSMTDGSSLGSMTQPAARLTKLNSGGWMMWERLAHTRPEFGNPAAFTASMVETCWMSFTVTCKNPEFFDKMAAFTKSEAGTGGLITFKDSRWLLSIVLYHQPHFVGQPAGQYVFWGQAMQPDRVGDFVGKPMSECTGTEILRELCGHLNFDVEVFDRANCIPCRMPYITSAFMPRTPTDRPAPVPQNSKNLAFISQFVEMPDDVVFTVEYSVRAAQTAVYQLLKIARPIPPVKRPQRVIKDVLESLVNSASA